MKVFTVLGVLTLLLSPVTVFAQSAAPAENRMEAPAFQLSGTDGKSYNNENLRGKTVVLEWFNPGCPFVKRVYERGYIPGLQKEATAKGVVWITVNSTNSEHGDYVPAESVPNLMSEWKMAGTAYALDADGKVGRAFDIKTTPTVVVIDPEGKIAYTGAVDNYPQISGDETKLEPYARDAVMAVSSGKKVQKSFVKSYGCSVKYAS